jgi:hypothetical protein
MAVVTLKYIKSKPQIKAHLRYITHRRGETRERITRLLFGRDGLTDKRAAYEMIDSGKRGTAFFKIMISPDPVKERYPQRFRFTPHYQANPVKAGETIRQALSVRRHRSQRPQAPQTRARYFSSEGQAIQRRVSSVAKDRLPDCHPFSPPAEKSSG